MPPSKGAQGAGQKIRNNMILKNLYMTIMILASVACGSNGSRGTDGVVADSSGMVTVSLSKTMTGTTFSLNEVAEGITVSRLETTDASLMRYFHGHVGSRYIISVENSKILLFTSGGSFLGEIARRGKGPGEFQQIDAWDVAPDEEYFIYHDKGKDYFEVYDLGSKTCSARIPIDDKGGLDDVIIMNDTLMAVLPDMFSQYGYLFFYQTNGGLITDGIEKEPVPHPGAWAGMAAVFIRDGNGSLAFQPVECDTVFTIRGTEMKPILRLKTDKPEISGDDIKGSDGQMKYICDRYLFIDQTYYEKTISPGNASIGINGVDHYLFFREDASLLKTTGYILKYQGIDIELAYLGFSGGNRFYSALKAADFNNMVIKQLGSTGLLPEQKQYWTNLMDGITENDNPVIIAGRIK